MIDEKNKNNNPLYAKGRRYPIEISCVAWVDLLGYGKMLEIGKFDPSCEETVEAVTRLDYFHELLHKNTKRLFPIFIMNDGACLFRDLKPRTSSVTYDFIIKCINLFEQINKVEHKNGFPGARMVIATGPRIRSKMKDLVKNNHIDSILQRYKEHLISAEQAIHESFRARSEYGLISELQANFAFTRAYLAESGGKSKGFPGNNCFIDRKILKNYCLFGIDAENSIPLNDLGLNTDFFKIGDFNTGNVSASDFNSGYEICELLDLDFRYDKYIKVER